MAWNAGGLVNTLAPYSGGLRTLPSVATVGGSQVNGGLLERPPQNGLSAVVETAPTVLYTAGAPSAGPAPVSATMTPGANGVWSSAVPIQYAAGPTPLSGYKMEPAALYEVEALMYAALPGGNFSTSAGGDLIRVLADNGNGVQTVIGTFFYPFSGGTNAGLANLPGGGPVFTCVGLLATTATTPTVATTWPGLTAQATGMGTTGSATYTLTANLVNLKRLA